MLVSGPDHPFLLMLRSQQFALILLVTLIFIAVGDKFLPKPLSTYSTQTRNTLNQMMLGSFPSWQPKTKPYERTEDALRQQEQRSGN